jgi:hypothetical protein
MGNDKDLIVSMPIPDTLPGPGTYLVKMDNTIPDSDADIPNIIPIESIKKFSGQGTAHDVASTNLSPQSLSDK